MNGDLTQSVYLFDRELNWQSSPASAVSRKRFHLVGEPESGQVTSHVRYDPGAKFPYHEHPDGEEILVLSGVFSDEAGDWPAGTYLLNPEGFGHSPFSEQGCELFVKLRQYPGDEHLAINHRQIDPEKHNHGDYEVRVLFSDAVECVRMIDIHGSFSSDNTDGLEGYILQGHLTVNGHSLGQYDWFRLATGDKLDINGEGTLYLKTGGFSRLRSSP